MKIKNSKLKVTFIIIILFSWILLSLFYLLNKLNYHYGLFTEKENFNYVQYENINFDKINLKKDNFNLVHIEESDCFCNSFTEKHIKLINKKQSNLNNIHIDKKFAENNLNINVPSTPMLLIIKDNNLLYAGAYASGATCDIDNSLINSFFNKNYSYIGTVFSGEIRTCRCL